MKQIYIKLSFFLFFMGSAQGATLKAYVYDNSDTIHKNHKTTIYLKELNSEKKCQAYLGELQIKVIELVILINKKQYTVKNPFSPGQIVRPGSLWSQKIYATDINKSLQTQLTQEGADLFGIEFFPIVEMRGQESLCAS